MNKSLENLQDLQSRLNSVRSFIKMKTTTGHGGSFGVTSPAHSQVNITHCWQAYAGANNYHETGKEACSHDVTEAACQMALEIFRRAEANLEKKIQDARIARKGELEAELKAIEKMEASQ